MTGPGTTRTSGATPAPPAAAADLSPHLYNPDLAPTTAQGRRWKAYNIFTLWAGDVHSLGNYGFVLGLFALGLGAWQILLAPAIGAVPPVLEPFAPFSWPVGAALGAVITVLAAPRGATYRAVSGEPIAVTPSQH